MDTITHLNLQIHGCLILAVVVDACRSCCEFSYAFQCEEQSQRIEIRSPQNISAAPWQIGAATNKVTDKLDWKAGTHKLCRQSSIIEMKLIENPTLKILRLSFSSRAYVLTFTIAPPKHYQTSIFHSR